MKRFFLASALMVAVVSGSLFGETVLTVDSAVESALRNNVSAQRSSISYDALVRSSSLSWNEFLPSVTASASTARGTVSEITSYTGKVAASLSFSMASIEAVKKAKLNLEAGAITRETALRDVELATRKAFYSLLYEKENVDVLSATVDTARKQYEQTLAKQKAGLLPEVDVLSAQVTYENLKPDLETAKITLQNDLESFKQTIGIDLSTDISLDGSLETASSFSDIDLSNVAVASSTVAALEKNLAIAKSAKVTTMSSSWLPTFSLSWSYAPTKTDQEGSDWEDSGSVSAAVSLPLDGFLPFSKGAENVRSANDTVKDIELQLSNAKISARIERETLLRDIAQSKTTLKARQLSVSLAERNYSLTEDAYKRGTKDILSLQDSADSLQEARVALMKQSYTLISAVLDLEYAIGVPFGTLGR